MIVAAGAKPTTVGMFWEYTQADPQAGKDDGIISSDGLFFRTLISAITLHLLRLRFCVLMRV